MAKLTAEDFETKWDAERNFHFIETEDATIMAWGHRDLEEFLDEVFVYDKLCSGANEEVERGEIVDGAQHRWAVRIDENDNDAWWITWANEPGVPITEDTEGAFPVTIWVR